MIIKIIKIYLGLFCFFFFFKKKERMIVKIIKIYLGFFFFFFFLWVLWVQFIFG